jgi:hypothetical protein
MEFLKNLMRYNLTDESIAEAKMNWAAVLSIGAGLLLLIAGRKFFWLAAGLAAFVFGLSFIEAVFKDAGWIGIILSVIGGIIFGWLAVKFIRIAGYIIGALAGATALPFLLGLFGVAWSWLTMALIGAVLGFLLVRFFFDWGLIIMTAWIGANAVVSSVNQFINLGVILSTIGFILLLITGILSQRRMIHKA